MPEYDFSSLSDRDFERLVRDLLQKKLCVTLESFKAGRDKGIDLRHCSSDGGVLIVQCKHYLNTPFSGLLSKLRTEERPKLERLRPRRYILATSLGLTPDNKNALLGVLNPYCLTPEDIYGRDDLNNLLTQFPEVERSNVKLWLTSSAVMQRVIHSSVFSQTRAEVESIRDKAKLYVQNASFSEAQKILSEYHYCIISGIPGIGKTTLAEMLLIDHVGRGYEAYEITRDVSDAFGLYDEAKHQVFYYDDFLGQTSLKQKLGKNEDRTLLKFIHLLRTSERARLILTTREYLLNQAKATYEKLENSDFDLRRCVIEPDSYTYENRANILANHVYFSNIPQEHKEALYKDDGYLTIVGHQNFNPRIVEWMTGHLKAMEIPGEEYLENFLANLSDQSRLWAHAFERQISEAAQHLLLVLATLPPNIDVSQLQEAFTAFFKASAEKYGFATSRGDFLSALKELEGTFISVWQQDGNNLVRFHNPSARDFVENYLTSAHFEIDALRRTAISFQQYVNLWNLRRHPEEHNLGKRQVPAARRRLLSRPEELVVGMTRTFEVGDTARHVRYYPSGIPYNDNQRPFLPLEGRLIFAITVADVVRQSVPAAAINQMFKHMFGRLTDNLEAGLGDKESLHSLLTTIGDRKLRLGAVWTRFLAAAKHFFMQEPDSLEDFFYFLKLGRQHKNLMSPEEMRLMAGKYDEYCDKQTGCYTGGMASAADIRAEIEMLELIGEDFDVDMEMALISLNDYAEELEEEEEEDESDGG